MSRKQIKGDTQESVHKMTPPIPQIIPASQSLTPGIIGAPVAFSETVTSCGGIKATGYMSGPVPWIQNIYAARWSSANDLESVLLEGLVPTQHWGDPSVCWLRDRFIFASARTAFLTIGEYRADGSQITRFTAGDSESRNPIMLPLASGALLAVNCKHVGALNLEMHYRSPGGAWASRWETFTPTSNLVPSCRLSMHQFADGTICLFLNRDGSNTIDRFLIRENASFSGVQVVEWIGGFLRNGQGSPDGAMMPHGEFPWPVSAYDPWKNRILLSYQNNTSGFFCGVGVSKTVVVAVTLGASGKQLLYASPTYIDQQFSLSPVFPGPDGFDLLQFEVNQNACAQKLWRMTRVFYDGQPTIVDSETIPGARGQMTWSQDGYGIYQEPDNKYVVAEIGLTQLRPRLAIEKTISGVIVRAVWNQPADAYDLQSRTDYGAWVTEPRQNGDVWNFPVGSGVKFFQLKKR